MATPVVLTTGARPIVPVESGGVPMTPVDTLGEPVTVVDTLGEPVVLINEDGTPAFLAYSAKTYLGGVAPYHWLDFINNRALYASVDVGNVTGATGYSFTRASDGYYTNSDGTLTNFASGALRRGDRGVLIEGSRTNLVLQSQTFDNASWTKSAAGTGSAPVVTANTAVAPDGTMTADTIVFALNGGLTSSDLSQLSQTVAALAGQGTWSVFLKTTDASTKTITLIAPSGDLQKLTVTGSWQRFSVSGSGGTLPRLRLRGDDTVSDSASLHIWGAQLEAASFPSSYIPTVAASATRASDVLTYTVNTTAQIQAAVAGQAELVTNGEFATDSDWTKGTGWTITGGAAVATAVAPTTYIEPSVPLSVTAGRWYAVSFTATVSSGGVGARIGGVVGTARISSGTYVELFFATSTANLQLERRINDFTGTIDNVSVKEVPANSLTLYPLSLWAEFERAVDTGGFEEFVNVDDGDSSDRATVYADTTGIFTNDMRSGNVNQGGSAVAGAVALNTVTKGAGRFQTNDTRAARGGTLGPADTLCTLPATPTRLVLGAAPSFGYTRRIAVFTTALTDAQLQTTTS